MAKTKKQNEQVIEKVTEKILKLLELAKSPNETEAKLAAMKAQELMNEYNITVLSSTEKFENKEGVTASYGKSYRFRLAKIIADNFGVKNYYLNKMTVVFYGHPVNVETAVKVYDYLHNMIHRMADSHQTKVYNATKTATQKGCTKGAYNSFVTGFLDGLKQQLDEQCKALQIVVPQDTEDAWKDFSKDFTSFKSKGMATDAINFASYEEGFAKGQEFQQEQPAISA